MLIVVAGDDELMSTISLYNELDLELTKAFNQNIKLDNTNSWESIKTKQDQVYNNIINNAIRIEDDALDEFIEKQLEQRIPFIWNVDSNSNNENEPIVCRIICRRKEFADFSRYVHSKYGESFYANKELADIISQIASDYFAKQQSATMIKIVFKGREQIPPFVLKRLSKIANEIDNHNSVMFSDFELNQIIKNVLDNPDKRTARDYLACLIDYAKQNGGNRMTMFEAFYNMRGFRVAVSKLLQAECD